MNKRPSTVIGMGTGGPDHQLAALFDLYIMAQTGVKNPNICFLPASAADNKELIHYFYRIFSNYPCNASHLSLYQPHTADIEDFLLNQDVIYVPGGNTKCLVGLLKEFGLDKTLRKAYDNGTILAGGSAGLCLWFARALSDWRPKTLSVLDCLGILPYSVCPHYLSRRRRKTYKKAIVERKIQSGYAVSDGAALHFSNGTLLRSLNISQSSSTFQVEMVGDKLSHKKIKSIDLTEKLNQHEYIWNSPTFEDLQE